MSYEPACDRIALLSCISLDCVSERWTSAVVSVFDFSSILSSPKASFGSDIISRSGSRIPPFRPPVREGFSCSCINGLWVGSRGIRSLRKAIGALACTVHGSFTYKVGRPLIIPASFSQVGEFPHPATTICVSATPYKKGTRETMCRKLKGFVVQNLCDWHDPVAFRP